MRGTRNGSDIMTRLEMIKDGHELIRSKEGSDKFDLFLLSIGSSHLADKKGLLAQGAKPR